MSGREDEFRSALWACIPWVAGSGRGAAQQALVKACDLVGSDPWGWTAHPDVLARRLEVMPAHYRRKYLRRAEELGASGAPVSVDEYAPAALDPKEDI